MRKTGILFTCEASSGPGPSDGSRRERRWKIGSGNQIGVRLARFDGGGLATFGPSLVDSLGLVVPTEC